MVSRRAGRGASHRAAADGAAKNGTAWEVRADAAKAGTALFGPYLELPPGDYLALFRVRLVPAPDGGNGDSLGTFAAWSLPIRGCRQRGTWPR